MKWISIPILAVWLFCPFAKAASLSIAFLGYSNHYIDNNYDYNENHDLIGLSINDGFSIAHFTNSYNNTSVLVGWRFKVEQALKIQNLSISAGIVTGLVTGYERDQIITYINENISFYLIPQIILSYPITKSTSLSLVNGIIPDTHGVIFMHHLELSFSDVF